MRKYIIPTALALFVAACSGGDAPPADTPPAAATPPPPPALPAQPGGEMTRPEWFTVDEGAQTVSIRIIAGETPVQNYWNMNGSLNGELALTVPEGYAVTIDLVNQDPNFAHSIGVQQGWSNPMQPTTPDVAFEGAVTENPASMMEATMPGETETISFVADTAGEYHLICYVAGHTAVGMWMFFNVSPDGEAGVQGL